MGTVVAIESDRGVAIAGDTRAVDGGTVTGEHDSRVFDLGTAAVGAVGDPGDLQEFRRQVEAELQGERLERDDDPGIEELARMAARHARAANVDAVVAGRDRDGTARLREVGSDGAVLEATEVALGSGVQVAYGQLEDLDTDPAGEVGATARAVVETVVERDTATGGDVEVRTLDNDEGDRADGGEDGERDDPGGAGGP